jgi:hypothetical protein
MICKKCTLYEEYRAEAGFCKKSKEVRSGKDVYSLVSANQECIYKEVVNDKERVQVGGNGSKEGIESDKGI